jgi:hypothetical protein
MPGRLALLAVPIALLACRSPEERLADEKREQRAEVDALWEDFQEELGEDARQPRDEGLVARALGEAGRSYFEASCLALGRGDRPFALSGKLDAFLKEASTRRRCEDVARRAERIAALEREAAARR